MVVRLLAAVVARGGVVQVEADRLICRLPQGQLLPAELKAAFAAEKLSLVAALTCAPLAATVRHLLALTDAERDAYQEALAHDLAAWARADLILNDLDNAGESR